MVTHAAVAWNTLCCSTALSCWVTGLQYCSQSLLALLAAIFAGQSLSACQSAGGTAWAMCPESSPLQCNGFGLTFVKQGNGNGLFGHSVSRQSSQGVHRLP